MPLGVTYVKSGNDLLTFYRIDELARKIVFNSGYNPKRFRRKIKYSVLPLSGSSLFLDSQKEFFKLRIGPR
jgi:hypothetical protein